MVSPLKTSAVNDKIMLHMQHNLVIRGNGIQDGCCSKLAARQYTFIVTLFSPDQTRQYKRGSTCIPLSTPTTCSRPGEFDSRVSRGIDFRKLLIVEDRDLFGNAVHQASKFGKDLAGPGEIVITEDALLRIPSKKSPKARSLRLSLSGIELDAYSVAFR